MAHKPNITMSITDEEKNRLREMAKSFGLIIGRGRYAEYGSIRGLNQAIANGKLMVSANPDWKGEETADNAK